MQIVISLIGLCVIVVVVWYLLKDNKIETELKREQLKYYQRFNKLYDEEDDEDVE